MNQDQIIEAARQSHEANRCYCRMIGDDSQPRWEEAPDWQKESAIAGAQMIHDDPSTTPKMSHESWMKQKADDGWVYGETKDPEAKTHPCMVEYVDLPEEQRIKDWIFGAVVRAALSL